MCWWTSLFSRNTRYWTSLTRAYGFQAYPSQCQTLGMTLARTRGINCLLFYARNSIVRITSHCPPDAMCIPTGTSSGLFAPDWASLLHFICDHHLSCSKIKHEWCISCLKKPTLAYSHTPSRFIFLKQCFAFLFLAKKRMNRKDDHRLESRLRHYWCLGLAASLLQLLHQIRAKCKQIKH